jgi:hypothetical protein
MARLILFLRSTAQPPLTSFFFDTRWPQSFISRQETQTKDAVLKPGTTLKPSDPFR